MLQFGSHNISNFAVFQHCFLKQMKWRILVFQPNANIDKTPSRHSQSIFLLVSLCLTTLKPILIVPVYTCAISHPAPFAEASKSPHSTHVWMQAKVTTDSRGTSPLGVNSAFYHLFAGLCSNNIYAQSIQPALSCCNLAFKIAEGGGFQSAFCLGVKDHFKTNTWASYGLKYFSWRDPKPLISRGHQTF